MSTKQHKTTKRIGLLARLLGLAALAAALLAGSAESQARLDPYFFLRGRSFSKVTPRIVFVVDTSGSMGYKPGGGVCSWADCEDSTDNSKLSRLAGARRALHSVVTATADQADFALMAFDHLKPPASDSEVPDNCGVDEDELQRFRYLDEARRGGSTWESTVNAWGGKGSWSLCGDNKPYPYLRWDELGFNDGPGSENGYYDDKDLPAGPLVYHWMDESEFQDDSAMSPMRWRRVQFMDEFLGVHFKLDCTDSAQQARVTSSNGDYDINREVCDQDFYYWPYVDGFVGYSLGYDAGTYPNGYNVGRGNIPYCDSSDEVWTCAEAGSGTPVFDYCSDTASNSADCMYSEGGGPAVYDYCDSSCTRSGYDGSICPWAADNGYFGGSEEACCDWFQSANGGKTCHHYTGGTTEYWANATCGTDESCCEDFAEKVFGAGNEDLCKHYDTGSCLRWEMRKCGDDDDEWNWQTNLEEVVGIHDRVSSITEDPYNEEGSLLAPLYFEPAIDEWASSSEPAKAGPTDQDWANSLVESLSAHQMYGGIDAAAYTPWVEAVGDVDDYSDWANDVNNSNAPFSHNNLASYLSFIQNHPDAEKDECVPTYAVLISDGYPTDCDSSLDQDSASQCGGLVSALAEIRNDLDVKTYVVGFGLSGGAIDAMACGAAGASSGCSGTPADDWDTCSDPGSSSSCAYSAYSPEELAEDLTTIVTGALDLSVPSGPGTAINVFNPSPTLDALQLQITASTDYPSWEGHVSREACDTQVDTDDDGEPDSLASWCQPPVTPPDESTYYTYADSDGGCGAKWTWDAGDCLVDMNPHERRLYSFKADNTLYKIANSTEPPTATDDFKTEFNRVTGANVDTTTANKIVQFILGYDWPGGDGDDTDPNDGWKLPGLAASAPITIRRIPDADDAVNPSVGIRDPHCAGRLLKNQEDVPDSLRQFAKAAWTPKGGTTQYFDYQNAVIVGDDLGVIHAFQLMSGNEIFGLIPHFMWNTVWEQYQEGADSKGQPSDLSDHHYGVSAVANHAWVFDDGGTDSDTTDDQWRHLLIMGMGIGGNDLIAMDVSHMGAVANDEDPVEVLWTTADSAVKDDYEDWLGETWSRPAVTYRFDKEQPDDLSVIPDAYVLFGSGYSGSSDPDDPRGRRIWLANALTGEVSEYADIPTVTPAYAYDQDEFGMVIDPAVATHCESRYWGEMEEVYFADPYGRLFRWDQGFAPSDTDNFHLNDGNAAAEKTWKQNGNVAAPATERFLACRGDSDTDCTVNLDSEQIGDPFFYTPAVMALDRLDNPESSSYEEKTEEMMNQMLLAMASGSMNDDSTNDGDSDFHASIYMLVDDHRPSHDEPNLGFSVPTGAPLTDPGDHKGFMRMALTDITRTREFTYPNGDDFEETREFYKNARVIRAPRISVTGTLDYKGGTSDPDFNHDIEVVTVTYTVYEPGDEGCSEKWKNDNDTPSDDSDDYWEYDWGSTYEVSFRLTVKDSVGFDFQGGAGGSLFDDSTFGDEGHTGAGLIGPAVTQLDSGACDGGVCGPQLTTPANMPCDPPATGTSAGGVISVPIAWSEVSGFNPVE